jgi:diguanylate cyclase (GGDEF)-like protein
MEDALARAESIRHMVTEIRQYYRGQPLRNITISIGVAMYPHHADTVEQLLRSADGALYEAKHQGRNRVILAEPPDSAPATSHNVIAQPVNS